MTSMVRYVLLIIATGVLAGCSLLAPDPPSDQSNICEIFREQP